MIIRVLLSLLVLALPSVASAKSWCARPLVVHEWGVQVFGGSGAPVPGGGLPTWFHRAGASSEAGLPVRQLPVDGGDRDLPVLHFYTPSGRSTVPVAIEVGFTKGSATAWFPRVDRVIGAAQANSAAAREARAALLTQRAGTVRPTPADPTRQLGWDFLELATRATHTPNATNAAWVKQARGLDALWVNTAKESERFVFYEGVTSEKTPLALTRGETFGPGRRHYILHNRGVHTVFDVFFVHRDKGGVYVFRAPAIPAGKSAGFLVEEHRVKDVAAATREALKAALTAEVPAVDDTCVMMRDPAIPFEQATGHQLFAGEADLVLATWGARFFDQPGTTIVYREAESYLDEVMPLSIYTDMYHHVVLRRAGLALWQGVSLP